MEQFSRHVDLRSIAGGDGRAGTERNAVWIGKERKKDLPLARSCVQICFPRDTPRIRRRYGMIWLNKHIKARFVS